MITNEIDALTLQYFLNRSKFEKNVNQLDEDNTEKIKIESKERKFYRKRIIQMTKDLFKNPAPNETVQSSFDGYIRQCIAYFKFTDINDVLQEEHENDNYEKDLSLISNVDDSKNPDELLFNKTEKSQTLDSFVVSSAPRKIINITPQKKKIELYSPELKNKGVKKRNTKIKKWWWWQFI